MNRHAVITWVAVAAIVAPFAHSGLSILGAQEMEYRWHGPGQFSFFTMSNHGEAEFCNRLPFWTSFQSMQVAAFYEEEHLGSFVMGPLTVDPASSAVHQGAFKSDKIAAVQHVFMTLDFALDGGDIRLDPNQFVVVIRTDTPIIGVIPYSSTVQVDGFDFDQMMNAQDLSCD